MEDNKSKYCVFCGKKPEDKNKEHILPRWLIELTGDPKRVVSFGRNFRTQENMKFDWSNFVFPACKKCNEDYSKLEENVKPIVIKMLNRESIRSSQIVLLLDWLDKVRTGLWIGYGYLQNNFLGIQHKFFINTRVGMKDRMLAVYPIESPEIGLNSFGVETLGFQLKPSCFSLRVNNIHILNMSWDFMCSARCGFPFPKTHFYNLDTNMIFHYDKLEIYNKVKHPIMKEIFIKPSIQIYQPILIDELPEEYKNHVYLRNKLLIDSKKYGALFSQNNSSVKVINTLNEEIDFDEITDEQSDFTKNIVKQTYKFQLKSLSCDDYHSISTKKNQRFNSFMKIIKKDLYEHIDFFDKS